MTKADFGTRAAALIIDGVLLSVASFLIGMIPLLGLIIGIVLPWAYCAYCWTQDTPFGVRGQTLGKKVMKIKVVMDDGSGLTMPQALMRCLGYFVTGLTFWLGSLLALREDRKALHDLIAGTQVVKV
ncbi:MAG: RDD family protein [Elusimicrobia bacterium]|nr:RDD family protein [Elusimicrobiota bacterium]